MQACTLIWRFNNKIIVCYYFCMPMLLISLILSHSTYFCNSNLLHSFLRVEFYNQKFAMALECGPFLEHSIIWFSSNQYCWPFLYAIHKSTDIRGPLIYIIYVDDSIHQFMFNKSVAKWKKPNFLNRNFGLIFRHEELHRGQQFSEGCWGGLPRLHGWSDNGPDGYEWPEWNSQTTS